MTSKVLITGAGTGLGLETALTLAERGFNVYASVLDAAQQARVIEEASQHGVTLHAPIMDVTDEAAVQATVEAITATEGAFLGVVHNAGISLRGYFEDCDDDEIRKVFEVNLMGAMVVTRAVLPTMRQAGSGRLIFVSSVGARVASMGRTAYCASKFALEGFAESLMQEITPLGIHVSIVEPAIIKTERWTVHRGIARRAQDPSSPYYAWFQRQEQLADELVRTSPTTPEQVADTIYRALTEQRPRLRYIVGKRARLVITLRRYLPGELFERFYFGEAMKRVTNSG
ncbi:MAG: SDR family oxidoreductase [Anaerolineae bacterium]|nr:SDR family oxidoreductase [Anaerolineae bacterium]MCB0203267.1 SDR family oxidoreductase [Anaerolineae bacterium]